MSPRHSFMLDIIQKIGTFQHTHYDTEIAFETKNGALDLVSFVDRESEEMFRKALKEHFPEDAIMGEETFDPQHDYSQHERLWIIDPLDGTLMFKRGIPTYCPTIAYIEHGAIQCSAIYIPESDEIYHADETGAYKNNQQIQVSKIQDIKKSLIRIDPGMLKNATKDINSRDLLYDAAGSVLNFYTAAYSACLCASGRLEGDMFFPRNGNIWDTIPGGFLVQQAGGRVTNFGSNTWDIFNPQVIFSNGHIHAEFQKLLES